MIAPTAFTRATLLSMALGLGWLAALAQQPRRPAAPDGTAAAAPAQPARPAPGPPFRGVYFNPKVTTGEPSYSWLSFYPRHRSQVQAALRDLVREARINLVDIFVSIPYSLRQPARTPPSDRPFEEWANLDYLDQAAAFVDDCWAAGVSVEIDLASNMWIPYSVDPRHQIANSGHWPMPGETPWESSAAWYAGAIRYLEARAAHPEAIALWCMMGNYELGCAEPCLWERNDQPAILRQTEQFVKRVWPVFRAAGRRPKAPPIMLPIFSTNDYWRAKSPAARLSAFHNLKQWIVDDLALPPDYWVMTSYPLCDPAPDGVFYFREIAAILGPQNVRRLISTDLKGPGHSDVAGCIMSTEGRAGPDLLNWHFQKGLDYGFAGWWIWAYQDTPADHSGIRDLEGRWKAPLIQALRASPW